MQKYVLANWKSTKTLAEARHWLQRFLEIHTPQPELTVIIAPAFPFLASLQEILADSNEAPVYLAGQDVSPFPQGAYTGAVAAEMINGMVDYVLVGHSERRRWFHESDQEVANKVFEARAAGITPIICVDQPYARSQFAALSDDELRHTIIGYGPRQAAGGDIPVSAGQIRDDLARLRAMAPESPILYGGSVRPDNAGGLMAIAGLAGLMVASASQQPEDFADICRQVGAA